MLVIWLINLLHCSYKIKMTIYEIGTFVFLKTYQEEIVLLHAASDCLVIKT